MAVPAPPRYGADFLDFIGRNPAWGDFLGRGVGKSNPALRPDLKPSSIAGDLAATNMLNLGGFGASGLPMGLSTLNEILFSQGKTDPTAMNRNISAINRDTQGSVQDIGDEMSRRGLSGSGLGMALQGAARGSGASRVAGARADEATRTEQRKRDDLGLLMDLIIGPSLQSWGIGSGVQANAAANSSADKAAKRQQTASIVAAIAAGICWVGRAVYGEQDPRWLLVRRWMLTLAPTALLDRYVAHGPGLAELVKRSPHLRALLRPSFDRMVAEVI